MINEVKILIPENLKLEELSAEKKQYLKEKKIRIPQLLYLLTQVVESRILKSKQMEEHKNKFTPLYFPLLQRVVHNTRACLDFLLTEGILITDNRYLIGKKSKGYAYAEKYDGQELKEYAISDYRISRSIKKSRKIYQKDIKKNTKSHSYLTHWWDTGKLDIDKDGAFKWIENYLLKEINTIKCTFNESVWNEEIRELINKTEVFKQIVIRIKSKTGRYAINGVGCRFYNPITNLKRELRGFLTYDGKPLVEIDIKNSQPYMSLVLLKPEFWKTVEDSDFGKKISLKYLLGSRYSNIDSNTIIMNLINAETQYSIDLQKYKNLVLSGEIYEYIQEFFHPLYPDRFKSRLETKIEVLMVMYSNPTEYYKPFYKPCFTFKQFFPEVYRLFKEVKKRNYKNLPLILQRFKVFWYWKLCVRPSMVYIPNAPSLLFMTV